MIGSSTNSDTVAFLFALSGPQEVHQLFQHAADYASSRFNAISGCVTEVFAISNSILRQL